MAAPEELKYTKDYEWVRVESDIAYVGITDHAQDALGDIVFVEVPEMGRELARGDEACNIESVKAASPVYAPVSGKVVEVNEELDEAPERINQKPYQTAIFALKMSDPTELDTLLSASEYEALLAEEKER